MRFMDSKYRLARSLRSNSTDAEMVLWRVIRNRNLLGVKFKRQQCIGPYVVDFYVPQHRLIIELDGGQHAVNQRIDDQRTRFLTERGYRVIRFWNNEILKDMRGVFPLLRIGEDEGEVSF